MLSDTPTEITSNIAMPVDAGIFEQQRLKPSSISFRCFHAPETADVMLARNLVEAHVKGLDEVLFDKVSRAAGELVANVWRHAKTPFVLECEQSPDGIRICVMDGGRGFDLPGWLSKPIDLDELMSNPTPEDSLGVGLKAIHEGCEQMQAYRTSTGFCVAVYFKLGE